MCALILPILFQILLVVKQHLPLGKQRVLSPILMHQFALGQWHQWCMVIGHIKDPPYVSPQKLQIVKPMEGSVTLLWWKLLATPQLGRATPFFIDAELPGVLRKGSGFSRPD